MEGFTETKHSEPSISLVISSPVHIHSTRPASPRLASPRHPAHSLTLSQLTNSLNHFIFLPFIPFFPIIPFISSRIYFPQSSFPFFPRPPCPVPHPRTVVSSKPSSLTPCDINSQTASGCGITCNYTNDILFPC